MTRLRSYASMKPKPSLTRAMLAVYALVDGRAEGRCEVALDGVRCSRRWADHHHTVKPRRSHTTTDEVIAICRGHHDRTMYPYKRGRLAITPLGDGRFTCAIVTAPDKFTYRSEQETA